MDQNNQDVTQQKSGNKKVGCWIAGCLTALIIVVLFFTGIISIAFFATKAPAEAVKSQLAALRAGDIQGAYALTSKEFQKTTNFAQFKNFISAYPSLLQNRDASFLDRKIENDVAYIKGTLTAINGSKTPVLYQLIKEDGVWKILYVELSASGVESIQKEETVQTEPSNMANIAKIEVGTQRAANGSIQDPGINFPQDIGDIKVSAYISGLKKGQVITAVWYFAGEQISKPVSNIIEEDGDFISQFYLGRPTNGWPTGKYKVVISVDKGTPSKEYSYSIGL